MAAKRGTVLFVATGVLLMLAGCSTSPCADFLDFCSPGRYPAKPKTETGGVCIPQGGQVGGAIGGPPVAPFAPDRARRSAPRECRKRRRRCRCVNARYAPGFHQSRLTETAFRAVAFPDRNASSSRGVMSPFSMRCRRAETASKHVNKVLALVKGIADEALACRIDHQIELFQGNIANQDGAFIRQSGHVQRRSRPSMDSLTKP